VFALNADSIAVGVREYFYKSAPALTLLIECSGVYTETLPWELSFSFVMNSICDDF
jgi:hypothetical protein